MINHIQIIALLSLWHRDFRMVVANMENDYSNKQDVEKGILRNRVGKVRIKAQH